MKVLLLLLFAFTFPFFLFLATILFGNTSTDALKSGLRKNGAYKELSNTFTQKDVKNADGGELYGNFMTKRFNPEYIQLKAEDAIDKSSDWIKGKTQTEPVVNFKELKEDIVKKYPFFIKALQNVPSQQEMESYGLNVQEQQEFLIQRASISTFVKNDFSLPLGHYLEGIKEFYTSLKFVVPVLTIVLLILLIILTRLSGSWPKKFNWLGATFLSTALLGFAVVYFNSYILTALTALSIIDKAAYLAIITPILIAVLKFYMDAYLTVQSQANIVLLVIAGLCFAGAILAGKVARKNQIAPTFK